MGKYKVGGCYLEYGCTPRYGVDNQRGYEVAIASSQCIASKIARALNLLNEAPKKSVAFVDDLNYKDKS